MRIAKDNVVPWRVDVPERGEDGELITVPVVFRFRIYTRQELRDKAHQRAAAARIALADAMRSLVGVKLDDPAGAVAVEAAAKAAEAAERDIYDADDIDARELAARIVGWRARDVTDEETGQPIEFTEQLRDVMLTDEARFHALRVGLLEASHGARRKNSLPGPAGSPAVAQGGEASNSGGSQAAS